MITIPEAVSNEKCVQFFPHSTWCIPTNAFTVEKREIASKEKYLIFHLKRCIAACRGGGVKVFFNHRNRFHLFILQLITLRTAVVESIFFAHFKLHSTNQLDANRVLWIFIPLNSSDGMKPCNSIVNWI